jgi:predicted CoA-substrate-specific enzyme activase
LHVRYAGCDLGTVTAKVVIMEDDAILASEIMPYKKLPVQAATEVFERALAAATVSPDQIDYCVATGFGKKAVRHADATSPEIVCLNRAFRLRNPDVRTVVDVGGQSMRAVNFSDRGKVVDSAVNEKCAAGTGKFIEVMARALELSLDEVGRLPFEAANPVSITSQCGVFAESEVITHVNTGMDRADIVAGITRSVAAKVSSLIGRISLDPEVAMVGGVALNAGVRSYVEEELGLKLVDLGADPRVFGALGAALVAREKHAA